MHTNREIITIDPHTLDDQTSSILISLMSEHKREIVLHRERIYLCPHRLFDVKLSKTIAIQILKSGKVIRGTILSNEINRHGNRTIQGNFFVMIIDPLDCAKHPNLAHLLNSRPEKTIWRANHAYLTTLNHYTDPTILILKNSLIQNQPAENCLRTYSLEGSSDSWISFYTVDPLNLCVHSSRLLAEALRHQPNTFILESNFVDPVSKQNILLKYNLIKDTRDNQDGPIYHIIGTTILGAGSDGKVYPILGSLQYTNLQLELIEHPKLVVKVQKTDGKANPVLFRKYLYNEYSHSKDVEYLQMQMPIETPHKCYSVLKHVEGIELLLLFNKIAFCKLSTNFRFKVTLALLDAYISQIKARQLTHFDLKLENIMVYLSGCIKPDINNAFLFDPNEIILKIIDFAYAKKYNVPIDSVCGSVDYVSPEVLDSKNSGIKSFADEKPDIYALGNCLKIFWGFLGTTNIRSFLSPMVMKFTYDTLYKDISPSFSLILFAKITNSINKMNIRSGIFEALQDFQDVYKEYLGSTAGTRAHFGLKNNSGLPFFSNDTKVYANNVKLHTYVAKL